MGKFSSKGKVAKKFNDNVERVTVAAAWENTKEGKHVLTVQLPAREARTEKSQENSDKFYAALKALDPADGMKIIFYPNTYKDKETQPDLNGVIFLDKEEAEDEEEEERPAKKFTKGFKKAMAPQRSRIDEELADEEQTEEVEEEVVETRPALKKKFIKKAVSEDDEDVPF